MTKKIEYTLIILLACLVVFGIVLTSVMLANRNTVQDSIILKGDGVIQEELNIELGSMYPGESREYTVSLQNTTEKRYDIGISFAPGETVTLAEYVDLEIICGNTTLIKATLSEFLYGEEITFAMEAETETLVFRYSIPLNVGNEAQSAAAEFDITINARPGV